MQGHKVNKCQDSSYCSARSAKYHDLSHSQVYPLVTSLLAASGISASLFVSEDCFLKNWNNMAIPLNH